MADRTNEVIRLSLHQPLEYPGGHHAAELYVDHDADSSFSPPAWVGISLTDERHDSDTVRMTYEEAELLYERLALILGIPTRVAAKPAIDAAKRVLDYYAEDMEHTAWEEIASALEDIPDCESWTATLHVEHDAKEGADVED